jgi:hypothetical protein
MFGRCCTLGFVLLLSACGGMQPAEVVGGGGSGEDGGAGDGGGVPPGGSCALYQVPSSTNLNSPTVSFKTDVMKLFNNSCGLSTCHGSTSAPAGGLFLGVEGMNSSDAATVYAGLMGKASGELTTMPFVTAGDPSKSYIMHKLDGDQCAFDAECVGKTCQTLMPSGGNQLLPVGTRDTLRRWIAQGAKND